MFHSSHRTGYDILTKVKVIKAALSGTEYYVDKDYVDVG